MAIKKRAASKVTKRQPVSKRIKNVVPAPDREIIPLPFVDGRVQLNAARDAPVSAEDNPTAWHLPPVDWATLTLTPFKRAFYVSPRQPVNPKMVQTWLTKHSIAIIGKQQLPPFFTFSEIAGDAAPLIAHLQWTFTKPTLIQSIAWPLVLAGRDVIGIAETGSGKTLAFAVPALVHAAAQPPVKSGEGPIVLIVAPTRELAVQIHGEFSKLTSITEMRITCVYGGADREQQVRQVRKGVEVCISTVGRLMDLIQSKVLPLTRVTFFCMDEADRLLDMGFGPQVTQLAKHLRPDRQTLMWSATWPPEVQQLAQTFLATQYIRVHVGAMGLTANPNVTQQVIICSEKDKFIRLQSFLLHNPDLKMLIFVATKEGCRLLERAFMKLGIRVYTVHSDISQAQRERALNCFRGTDKSLLLATDVAARGLDIDDVKAVVNYDFPPSIQDYIHRIGRTGRAGERGVALSFMTTENAKLAGELIRVLKEAGQPEAASADLQYLHLRYQNKPTLGNYAKAAPTKSQNYPRR
eukprot:NODE_1123_length_1647_cov_28.647368_g1056_i0.p1 GENE.NODE_1123_length_1647_cov_28.647368_g1056_i0~~NODE_1123_length_1647_cov_28.647368_g1056_i0.p1  ORF type:complete len:534 (+),score=124.59 NODE_1123_length_1647_cov_28.647368_g1056_i0:39-1604(+)